MTVFRIKYFLAVVISGTFSEAAEVLYTTQATVSKQIMALEKELGVTLFDRSKRKTELTHAGQIFLGHAQKILNDYNLMVEELSAMETVQSGVTSLVAIPVMAHYGMISLIGEFRKTHPQFQMIVDERESGDILRAVEQQHYEMAFTRSDGVNQTRFQSIGLCTDRLAAVLPAGHPLAEKECLPLSLLAWEDFLLLSQQTKLYRFCVNACKAAGFEPHVAYTATRIENIVAMVSQGMGVSLLMEATARFSLRPGVTVVPIEEKLQSSIVLVRLRKRTPSVAGEAFWQFIRAKKAHAR